MIVSSTKLAFLAFLVFATTVQQSFGQPIVSCEYIDTVVIYYDIFLPSEFFCKLSYILHTSLLMLVVFERFF